MYLSIFFQHAKCFTTSTGQEDAICALKLHILEYRRPLIGLYVVVHAVQATYFDQKFHATFFLAPDEAGIAPSRHKSGTALRDSTPPRTDPRGHSKRAEDNSAADNGSHLRGSTSEPPQRRSSRFSAWRNAEGSAEQLLTATQEAVAARTVDPYRATEPQQQLHPAMQPKSSLQQPAGSSANTPGQGQAGNWSHEEEELLDREVQDELLATIEEQDQALRSATCQTARSQLPPSFASLEGVLRELH